MLVFLGVIFALALLIAGALWQLRATRVPLSRTVSLDLETEYGRKLEARMKSLETEWTNTYDKLNRLAGRLARERGFLQQTEKLNGEAHTPTTDALALTDAHEATRKEVLHRWRSRARGF